MCDAVFRDETIGPLTVTRFTPINDGEFPRLRSLASPDAAATRDLRPATFEERCQPGRNVHY